MGFVEKMFDSMQPHTSYGKRVCAYVIPFDENNRIAVAKIPIGCFLLGGGIENGESHYNAITRECMEEVGCRVYVGNIICRAERYHWMARFKRNMHVIAYLYSGRLLDKTAEPIEKNHTLVWLTPEECEAQLYLEHQRWAVRCAIGNKKR